MIKIKTPRPIITNPTQDRRCEECRFMMNIGLYKTCMWKGPKDVHALREPAIIARRRDGYCGPSGRLWEPVNKALTKPTVPQ